MNLKKDIEGLHYDGDFWYTITQKFKLEELLSTETEEDEVMLECVKEAIELLQGLDEELMAHKDFEEM